MALWTPNAQNVSKDFVIHFVSVAKFSRRLQKKHFYSIIWWIIITDISIGNECNGLFFVPTEEEERLEDHEDTTLLDRCANLIYDIRKNLLACVTSFDKEVSELLMTLQLIHPPNVSRIASIDHLITFRGYVLMHSPQTLSTSAIDRFIGIRQQFIDKVCGVDITQYRYVATNYV